MRRLVLMAMSAAQRATIIASNWILMRVLMRIISNPKEKR
jgi:hypothetical protein